MPATTAEDFRRVLDQRAVQPVFQPLVDLDSRQVLGSEALARGRCLARALAGAQGPPPPD